MGHRGQAGGTREVVTVEVSYGNMVTKATDSLQATVRASYTGSKSEVQRRVDREVMVRAVELLATERNRLAVVARDEGRTKEARDLLLGTARWLDSNAASLDSPRLRNLKQANEDDAANLAPNKWKARRKKMRREQYQFDMQQSF